MIKDQSKRKARAIQKHIHTRSKSNLKVTEPISATKVVKPVRACRSISNSVKQNKNVSKIQVLEKNAKNESLDAQYLKGQYIAFIDRDAVDRGQPQISVGKVSKSTHLKLIQILKTTPRDASELIVMQFNPAKNQDTNKNFTCVSWSLTIKEYQILCDIEVDNERRREVIITNKSQVEATRLYHKLLSSISDRINQEIDDEAELMSLSEDDQSDMSQVVVNQKRTIVRGKRSVTQLKSDTKKVSANKIIADKDQQIKSHSDIDQNDDEDLKATETKIGKKRTFKAAATSRSISQQNCKFKKLDQNKAQKVTVPKVKQAKAQKPVVVYKPGKWNTDTVVLQADDEIERYGQSDTPQYMCCIRCNTRNVVRAISTRNFNLLRACLNAKDQIPYICAKWSQDTPYLNPLEMIIKNNDLEVFKEFYKIIDKPNPNLTSQYNYHRLQEIKYFTLGRVQVRPTLLEKIDTGTVSNRAYGTAIRQVQMTRGNRQGNQAFVLDDQAQDDILDLFKNSYFKSYVTPEMYQLWCDLSEQSFHLHKSLYDFVLAGNLEMLKLAELNSQIYQVLGYTKLHIDALYSDQLDEKYHTEEIIQKAHFNVLTPLHFACLNKSSKVLATLFEQYNNMKYTDKKGYHLIHIAAINLSSAPLEYLISKGADLLSKNNNQQTPLHIAVQLNRLENIKILLKANITAIKCRDSKNRTPFAIACEKGDITLIETILDNSNGLIKINTGLGYDRMTPLMYAAAQGNYELAEFLLSRKARVLSKDKFKRTALIMAVKNGHVRLASLLLSRGSDWQHCDSSNNTALHYAAANGFIECIDLLIKHKADINAQNTWKVTPITVAFLNNHFGSIKRLLQEENIDINGKDDDGHSLLTIAIKNQKEPNCVQSVQQLLEHKADVNMQDLQMFTPLDHVFLEQLRINFNQKEGQIAEYKQLLQTKFDLAKLLLIHGADATKQYKLGTSPLLSIMQQLPTLYSVDITASEQIEYKDLLQTNFESIKLLLSYGADATTTNIYNKTLLYELASNPVQLKQSLIQKAVNQVNYNSNLSEDERKLLEEKQKKQLKDQQTKVLEENKIQLEVYNYRVQYQNDVIDLLLSYGASLEQKTSNGDTPFDIALQNKNIEFLLKFIRGINIKENDKLLFNFTQNIFDDRYRTILIQLLNQDTIDSSTINKANDQAFSPFLFYIDYYVRCTKNRTYYSNIRNMIKWNYLHHSEDESKYTMTNRLIFDQTTILNEIMFKESNEEINYKVNLTELTQKYYDELITKPFIELMQIFIAKGADPHYKVGKVKVQNPEYIQKQQNLSLKQNKKLKLNSLSSSSSSSYSYTYSSKSSSSSKKKPQVQDCDVLSQSSIESHIFEYSVQYGLKNAVHLLFELLSPPYQLYQFLVETLNIAHDDLDFSGNSPFLVNVKTNKAATFYNESIEKHFKKNININITDECLRNPFLIYYEHRNFYQANRMIDLGANINQVDHEGMCALKYAFDRNKDLNEIKRLISLGADINKKDNKGRNLLHYAINMSSASSDATFEIEQKLIEMKIDINARDNLGRVPLHYAFVKIKNWKNSSQIDPIETVSSLCGRPGLEIEVADKWHKTPLHYAAQRGATICTLLILSRGANLESLDIYNNTALNISLLRKHFSYSILLIQKNANVNLPVYNEYPDKIAEYWQYLKEQAQLQEQAKLQEQLNQDVEMVTENNAINVQHNYNDQKDLSKQNLQNSIDLSVIKYKPTFQSTFRHAINNNQQGLSYLIIDSKYDYLLAMQDALDEKQFNLVLSLLSKTADDRIIQIKNHLNQNLLHILAKNSNGGKYDLLLRIYNEFKSRGINCFENDNSNSNALHYAVQSNALPLCKILINDGININQVNNLGYTPLNYAIAEKSIELCKILIRNNTQASQNNAKDLDKQTNNVSQHTIEIDYINNKKQSYLQQAIVLRQIDICLLLISNGINIKLLDEQGQNYLHLVINQYLLKYDIKSAYYNDEMLQIKHVFNLCQKLIDEGINVNQVSNEGHSPFSNYIKGTIGANFVIKDYSKPENQIDCLFYLLTKNKANIDQIYPESSYDIVDYKCNYMINMVRRSCLNTEVLINNLKQIISFGVSLFCQDSNGLDVMMYAIKHNNEQIVQLLVDEANKVENNQGFQHNRDNEGKNAIHYIVNPLQFGSYENVKLLHIVKQLKFGFDFQAVDNYGKTPLDYANLQSSGALAKALIEIIDGDCTMNQFTFKGTSYLQAHLWPENQFNFDQDSQQLLAEAEAEQVKLNLEKKKDQYVPIDIEFEDEDQYSVFYEGENDQRRPFNAYMTKVDLAQGLYGDYKFYKMQMVYDSNRELYIVLTRYGRIGEDGMHQRSPFNTLEEAKKEFSTIFKQKSGNLWETALDNFIEQPNKYNLINVDYNTVEHKDLLVKFDYKNCAQSALLQSVKKLFKKITDVTMFQRSVKDMGIDVCQLPLSNLKKETCHQANSILSSIKQLLEDFDKIRTKLVEVNQPVPEEQKVQQQEQKVQLEAERKEKQEQISTLSTQFYKLIPISETNYWQIKPIDNNQLLKLQEQIDQLINIEFTTKVLLGALYKQKVVHPCDYVFDVVQTKITEMNKDDLEYKLIKQYINNTKNQRKIKFKIFKVERRGEGDKYSNYKHLENRRLLFHGTRLTNMLGILAQGLRIAPKEAPKTGYLFGKGIYLADQFEKSSYYCGGGYNDIKVMLLCEAALGKTLDLYKQFYVSELPDGYHSTRAIGRYGVDFNNSVVTPDGFQVPQGGQINQQEPSESEFMSSLRISQDQIVDTERYFRQNSKYNYETRSYEYYKNFVWQIEYNEFIVYNTDQVQIRYMIQWK